MSGSGAVGGRGLKSVSDGDVVESDERAGSCFQYGESSAGSSGISRSAIRSFPCLSFCITPVDIRLPLLSLLPKVVLWPPAVDSSLLEVKDVWISLRIGRRMGMHCTMMVPVISDEYLVQF